MKRRTNYITLLALTIIVSNSIGFCMFAYGMIITDYSSQVVTILQPNQKFIASINKQAMDGNLLSVPKVNEMLLLQINHSYKANQEYEKLIEDIIKQVKIYNIINTSLWIGIGLLVGFTEYTRREAVSRKINGVGLD